jgi:CheY-like chemotaxis protein
MARILVIDDDRLVRGTIQGMLAADAHECVLAIDGEDGVRQFQVEQIDLVLCDIYMPRQDGLETIREIRRLSGSVPIVAMTGSYARATGGGRLAPEFLETSTQAGATKTIAKPFRLEELLGIVRKSLGPAPTGA